MKPERNGKKPHRRNVRNDDESKGRDKMAKVKKKGKMKKKMDWRDLLMDEEEDYFLSRN